MQVLTTIPHGDPNSTWPCQATWRGWESLSPNPEMAWVDIEQTLGPGHATPGYCQSLDIHKFFSISYSLPCSFLYLLHTAPHSRDEHFYLQRKKRLMSISLLLFMIYDKIWDHIGPKTVAALWLCKVCLRSRIGTFFLYVRCLVAMTTAEFQRPFLNPAHVEILFCKVLGIPSFFQWIQDLQRTFIPDTMKRSFFSSNLWLGDAFIILLINLFCIKYNTDRSKIGVKLAK